MADEKILVDIVQNWLGLMNRPLWQQIAIQSMLVAAVGLLSGWLLIGEVRRAAVRAEEQIVQTRLDVREIQQRIAAMPLLAALQTQLAEKTMRDRPLQADRLAQLIVEPLSQAGATLLLWQPAPRQADSPRQGRWQMAFGADYPGILQVLRGLTALPYALRITQLTVKPEMSPTGLPAKTQQLRVELSLIGTEEEQ